ncbi:hypothetical protein Tco_0480628, partial [Tanacetum coccineum]
MRMTTGEPIVLEIQFNLTVELLLYEWLDVDEVVCEDGDVEGEAFYSQLMKLPDANSVTRSLFSWSLDHLSSLDAISHLLDYSWSTRIASVAIHDCD